MNYEIYFNCYFLSHILANMSVINNIGTEGYYLKKTDWMSLYHWRCNHYNNGIGCQYVKIVGSIQYRYIEISGGVCTYRLVEKQVHLVYLCRKGRYNMCRFIARVCVRVIRGYILTTLSFWAILTLPLVILIIFRLTPLHSPMLS